MQYKLFMLIIFFNEGFYDAMFEVSSALLIDKSNKWPSITMTVAISQRMYAFK